MAAMIKPYECTQCGSTDFEDLDSTRVRCTHCGSLFRLTAGGPTVSIRKGAKVTFGRDAKVEIRGGMEIQDGADVDIQGDVTVWKKGKKQAFPLELIREGKGKKPKP
jgi:hypothetical protein